MALSPLLFFVTIAIISSRTLVLTVDFTSGSSLVWTNANSTTVVTYNFPLQLIFRAILQTAAAPELYGTHNDSISFAFGFYCDVRHRDTCFLAILMLETSEGAPRLNRAPEAIWAANRNHPVRENVTLRADPRRGLVLAEENGVEVWSTEIRGNVSVGSMFLGGNGDLVLFSSGGSGLRRSFLNPTDTLVIGQKLQGRQGLTSRTSNYDSSVGRFSLSVTTSALTAFMKSGSQHLAYLKFAPKQDVPEHARLQSVIYYGKNISFIYKEGNGSFSLDWKMTEISPVRILRLDWDGGVRYRVWDSVEGWSRSQSTLGGYSECLTPLLCGRYSVCTRTGCICPTASDGSSYFTPSNPALPDRGCSFADPFVPEPERSSYRLVEFGNLSYFGCSDPYAAAASITELGECTKACEGNSSCKAAFFRYRSNTSHGLCYLPSEILTLTSQPIPDQDDLKTVASIKVPMPPSPPSPSPPLPISPDSRLSTRPIIVKASAIVVSAVVLVIVSYLVFRKIKKGRCRVEDCFELVLGAPTRFSYKELSASTGKFSTRLGRGGFGTVFRGELKDGTAVAVKRLDCVEEQGTDEFLSEMRTLGSIHHYNLVKLIGFCAEESDRLLVYQCMSNGSLDKWIFGGGKGKQALTWEVIRRIILDVARGLAYLHEECSQRIAHLDMKPHNILLDESFNAKISDFGLARFIDRNQSQLVTAMKGTLGYLAPEWQNSRVTVKADVYSFGVVMLEAVSGRRNMDYAQPDSDVHLLGVLRRKASEGRLIDIVDKRITDWESHEEDIVKIIRIGAWCLNEDQTKRPAMSTVVKVLEGPMEMEKNIDFKFAHVLILSCQSSSVACPSISSSLK